MLTVGTLLKGRYRIEQSIGQGATGMVYQATDTIWDKHVAIKHYTGADHEIFTQEAKLLAKLDHPQITKISDYFVDGHVPFLVMEWVAGRDIQRLLQRSAIPIHVALRWAIELSDVLHYLHTHQPPVIHRDIKPSNLLLMNSHIKLADFGIAKSGNATMRSVHAGTLAYAAPEQIDGDPTDARSDLFSSAATFYHIFTGQPPASALERRAMVNRGYADPLEPPMQLNPQIPTRLNKALMSALALQPLQRPVSAQAWRAMLEVAQKQQHTPSPIRKSASRSTVQPNTGPTIALAPPPNVPSAPIVNHQPKALQPVVMQPLPSLPSAPSSSVASSTSTNHSDDLKKLFQLFLVIVVSLVVIYIGINMIVGALTQSRPQPEVIVISPPANASSDALTGTLLDVNTESDVLLKFRETNITVPRGLIRVTFKNISAVQHNWVLVKPGDEQAVVDDAGMNSPTFLPQTGVVASSNALDSGQSETISFTINEAGVYRYLCSFPGHYAAGMIGTLTVK